jgi:NAD-dependent deacetylase
MKVHEKLVRLNGWIKESSRIVVLTGAGVSTESGLKDFRSEDGVFKGSKPIETYLSRPYFNRNPQKFWKHYKDIFQLTALDSYEPNAGHLFLAELEGQGKDITIITQNVDGLHQRAGSRNVIEVHGTVTKAACPNCGKFYEFTHVLENDVPACLECGNVLSPGIVLYGDPIQGWEEAEEAIGRAELFMVMGTSLSVTPVNMFPALAKQSGIPYRVLINNEETIMNQFFNLFIEERLGQAVRLLRK